jgi:hypothetical protein
VDYVVIHADLSGLTAEEDAAFRAEAADLGLDVLELYPDAVHLETDTVVAISAVLTGVFSKLAELGTGAYSAKFLNLVNRLKKKNSHVAAETTPTLAIEERTEGFLFAIDDAAIKDWPAAMSAMRDVVKAHGAITAGTVLHWSPPDGAWLASANDDRSGLDDCLDEPGRDVVDQA